MDYHRHCQATILPAHGSGNSIGLSWNILNDLTNSLPNLPVNWINQFKSNKENITEDFASLLKIINESQGNFLKKSGGTMDGDLFLNRDPISNLQSATKQYVDSCINNTVTDFNNSIDDIARRLITGIKMNGISKGTSGVVDLGQIVTKIKLNNVEKTPNNGTVDLGNVLTQHQSLSDYATKQYVDSKIGQQDRTDVDDLFNMIYPIGSVYISIAGNIPTTFKGTWVQLATGRTLWNVEGTDEKLGQTIAEGLPAIPQSGEHTHTYTKITTRSPKVKNDGEADLMINTVDSSASTGSSGKHTHSGGVYGRTTNVQPNAIGVTMWQRTA